jgi:hypothetical protein
VQNFFFPLLFSILLDGTLRVHHAGCGSEPINYSYSGINFCYVKDFGRLQRCVEYSPFFKRYACLS